MDVLLLFALVILEPFLGALATFLLVLGSTLY